MLLPYVAFHRGSQCRHSIAFNIWECDDDFCQVSGPPSPSPAVRRGGWSVLAGCSGCSVSCCLSSGPSQTLARFLGRRGTADPLFGAPFLDPKSCSSFPECARTPGAASGGSFPGCLDLLGCTTLVSSSLCHPVSPASGMWHVCRGSGATRFLNTCSISCHGSLGASLF